MGQLLEMKIDMTWLGQGCISTFQWAETTPEPLTGVSFALATAIGLVPIAGAYPTGTPFHKLRLMMRGAVAFNRWTIRTLYSVTDFYEAGALPATNGLSADATSDLAPINAQGIKSNRVRTDVRAGSKRFPGLSEGMVATGGLLEAAQKTIIQTFCTSISSPISATVGGQPFSFSSAILPKQTPDDNDGNPGEFWPTYSAQLAKSAIGLTWTPYDQIRSQVSRQYGRGM